MTKTLKLMTAAASVLALTACVEGTTGPQLNKAQQGALVGAAAGALYGAQRDDDNNGEGRDIVKGALAGAALGTAVGAVLERQAEALRQEVSNPGIQIVNHGNYLSVVMPEGILFATDSAAVSGPAQQDLYAVARNLNQYPNSVIQVVGHTDSTGAAAYNLDLSKRRANSVSGILAAAGVNPGRLSAVGAGENQPVASNDTPAGRAQNRRVEIIIRPTS